jgi:hypothetical protein
VVQQARQGHVGCSIDGMSGRFVLREAKVVSGCMSLQNLLAAAEREGLDHFVVLQKADVVGVVDIRRVRSRLAHAPFDLVSQVMDRDVGNVVLEDGRVVGVLEEIGGSRDESARIS